LFVLFLAICQVGLLSSKSWSHFRWTNGRWRTSKNQLEKQCLFIKSKDLSKYISILILVLSCLLFTKPRMHLFTFVPYRTIKKNNNKFLDTLHQLINVTSKRIFKQIKKTWDFNFEKVPIFSKCKFLCLQLKNQI